MQTSEILLSRPFPRVLGRVAALVLLVLPIVCGFAAESPVHLSLDTNGRLQWTGGPTNGYSIVEHSTNVPGGVWSPVAYDLSSYNRTSILNVPYYLDVVTPMHTAQVALTQDYSGFYRIRTVTSFEETNLLLHFSFENDFPSQGMVLDVSGHGNHGLRYGYFCCPTTNRFPTVTVGPDGSQAAEFHVYADGWGDYGHSGDFIGIPTINDFTNLTQATFALWCHYYPFTASGCDCNSTPLQAGMGTGAWTLGRYYDVQTTFEIDGAFIPVLTFPDRSPSGESGGWHHYAVTFDHGAVFGYFDGTNCDAALVPIQALALAGQYLTLGGWTFNVDPWLNEDGHPNNAWINGALDDIRIYNRALTSAEVLALYASFDRQPPSAPQGLTARVDSSTQIELSWNAGNDNFRVDGYQLIRNGVFITNVIGTHYVDSGLVPLTTYSYSLKAYDPAGNVSISGPNVTTNTPAAGSGVEVVVDDAQGLPWAGVVGNWSFITDPNNPPNFYNSGYHAGFSTRGAVSVTFRPVLPESGNYQVYIWNPGSSSYSMWVFSSVVPVDIVSSTHTNTISVNEQINYATWNYLGTYTFVAGTNGFIRVRSDGTSGDLISADAVRFVK